MLQIFRAGWQPLLNHRAGWGFAEILKIGEHSSKEDNNTFQARLKYICYMILLLITDAMFTNKILVFIHCTTSPHKLHVYVAVPSNCIQHFQHFRANPAAQLLPPGAFPWLPFQGWWLSGRKCRRQSPVPALGHRAQRSQSHSL